MQENTAENIMQQSEDEIVTVVSPGRPVSLDFEIRVGVYRGVITTLDLLEAPHKLWHFRVSKLSIHEHSHIYDAVHILLESVLIAHEVQFDKQFVQRVLDLQKQVRRPLGDVQTNETQTKRVEEQS